MDLASFKFSPLLQTDNLSSFDCGLPMITDFLKDDAKFWQTEYLANTYLFWDNDDVVAAYFSISNDCLTNQTSSFFNNKAWNRLHRAMNLPNSKRIRQYPAVLVGRLGVHVKYQGTGVADQLMDFIKEYAVEDCKPACRLLLLDAVNKQKQIKYYSRNQFTFLLEEDSTEENRSMYF